MRTQTTLALLAMAALFGAGTATAQQYAGTTSAPATTGSDSTTKAPEKAPAKASNLPPITLQRLRPADKRGINVFETPKDDSTPYTGFRLGFGAAFTQQF